MESRRLILMRHATAESGGPRDHERALSPRGIDEAHRVGAALRERGPVPQSVLCSSALRCRQTWQAIATSFDPVPPVDFEPALYNASADRLLDVLAGLDVAGTVLLLAHNPGVSHLAFELARGDPASASTLRPGFSPATFACFEVEGPWSTLTRGTARLDRVERQPMS